MVKQRVHINPKMLIRLFQALHKEQEETIKAILNKYHNCRIVEQIKKEEVLIQMLLKLLKSNLKKVSLSNLTKLIIMEAKKKLHLENRC